eukprot:CAMPEP_0202443848 /NCGR_PEP_ID=MMETSP1360-20130828/3018_1 /ASSEMBLY_ACC=CAM_ASM_000848 /TAXON_ID=515479 /ORGANISM="Licmophora paradoxa, Strain CCMP2313" /LENGTH=44 /DNA_ID= /DNA_START= /DNA_END= /DNA_ORIENTATION=
MMRKILITHHRGVLKTILPAEQDPPQFTDLSDTKINEIDWSYYQ